MKKRFRLIGKGITGIKIMLLAIVVAGSNGIYAQERQSITGRFIEEESNQAVPFATVALFDSTGSKIVGGSMSDENGVFRITPVNPGDYILKVSNIGYKPATINIEVTNRGVADAGIIMLQETSIMIEELVVVGDRIRAKSESDRTTFNITKKMLDVSDSGTDLLKLIPGVQIDLMQNISLEGSTDILIFVDGKERDKNFISQLSPGQIDRIEVMSAPPSNYDGNVTGAINIVLKKDRDSGISGHLLAEIPVSSSLVYVFPSYSLNWGIRKINLYTSYNGGLTYLDLQESTRRKAWNENDSTEHFSDQTLKQKDWSHRFHYGLDYFLSDRDQLNFYGYCNPYSRELDGDVYYRITGIHNDSLKSVRDDSDNNTSTFYSLYYKHKFGIEGSEITADISKYLLRAENRTEYFYYGDDEVLISEGYSVKPEQNAFSLRIDFKTPFRDKFIFSTGVRTKLQRSQDRSNEFDYNEDIYAIYGNIAFKQEKIDFSLGLRAEQSVSELKDTFTNPFLSFLPGGYVRYKFTSKQSIQASFNRTIKRPNLYQLNPNTSLSDPYTVIKGNPSLKPELSCSLYLEHSIQFNGNYLASRLFFNRTTDRITNLMFINDTGAFETRVQNLGSVNQLGLQFSGTLKFGFATFNPYMKIFGLRTSGNDIARYYSIGNKNSMGFESGLSAIASFRHDIACSLTLQYSSAKYEIQGSSHSDVLYFLSLEKTFKQKIKLGIVTAMPFTRSFTYNGSKIDGLNFQSTYEGNVIKPAIPFWFKLGIQFNSGKSRDKISREKEEFDNTQKKGF